jgi:hypothetical protein
VRVLLTLDNAEFEPALVPASFFFKLLAHDGSEPVSTVRQLRARGPLVSFDAEVGGTLCANCSSGHSMSRDALELIRRIFGGDLAAVLREVTPRAPAK